MGQSKRGRRPRKRNRAQNRNQVRATLWVAGAGIAGCHASPGDRNLHTNLNSAANTMPWEHGNAAGLNGLHPWILRVFQLEGAGGKGLQEPVCERAEGSALNQARALGQLDGGKRELNSREKNHQIIFAPFFLNGRKNNQQ